MRDWPVVPEPAPAPVLDIAALIAAACGLLFACVGSVGLLIVMVFA